MLRPRLGIEALAIALCAGLAGACEVERTVEHEGGIHPAGFADKASPDFHATYLKGQYKENGRFSLEICRKCHGDDYLGGDAGFSCSQKDCHSQGVEWCGTCHNGKAPPQPVSGAHGGHTFKFSCDTCHHVPTSAREVTHPDGKVEVTLSGMAAHGGFAATWNPDERKCTTYCHGGGKSPSWDDPVQQVPCDTCHTAPPDNHKQFLASIGPLPDGCAPCHGSHDSPYHLNGQFDYIDPGCTFCHGDIQPQGAPPKGIDGATEASARTVGAHARHLDATLLDRKGRVVECETCHTIPTDWRAPGHLDTTAPADVSIAGGQYEPTDQRCVVACHWNKDPGVVWTDDSGKSRACDACHGDPPVKTREGVPHPQVDPGEEKCKQCHHFEPATHVDGHVDFLP